MDSNLPAVFREVERDGPARRRPAPVTSAIGGFCCSAIFWVCVEIDWLEAIRRRLYFRVAFGELTNLTAPKQPPMARAPLAAPFFARRSMSYRSTMVDEHAENQGTAPDATAIAAAHAICTPFVLSFYDRLVHGLSNRFAWRCPKERIVGLYRDNLSSRHLEAGVGTGFFIDRANPVGVRRAHAARHQPPLPGAVGAEAGALPPAVVRDKSACADRERA